MLEIERFLANTQQEKMLLLLLLLMMMRIIPANVNWFNLRHFNPQQQFIVFFY